MSLAGNFILTLKDRGISETISSVYGHILGLFHRKLRGRYLKKNIFTYKMFLDLNDRGISRSLLLFGKRELEHKYILENITQEGMTILDIGANIGYYALMELELIGDKGNLIAVEPSPSNIDLLRRNLKLNNYNNVEIHQAAVSDQSCVKKFHLSLQSNLNTFHNVGTGIEHLSGETIDVKTMTVQEIMSGRKLDLIRMDVEGHEVEIIKGLIPSIEAKELRPIIIFETHITKYDTNHNFSDILKKMFELGYKIGYVGSSSSSGTKIINSYGYKSIKQIKSDGLTRNVYNGIGDKDALEMICNRGGIRTVTLMPN